MTRPTGRFLLAALALGGGAESTAAGNTKSSSPTTDFDGAHDALSVINSTAAYLAPDGRAPQAYLVKPGTLIDLAATSRDGKWAWVNTAEETAVYIPMADLAPPPAADH